MKSVPNIYLFTENAYLKHEQVSQFFSKTNLEKVILNYTGICRDGVIIVYGSYSGEIKTQISRKWTMLIVTEPSMIRLYNKKYLNQFGKIIGANHTIKNLSVGPVGHPWFLKEDYEQLIEKDYPKKSNEISIITSNKSQTVGHKRRLEFCKSLAFDLKVERHLFGRGLRPIEYKNEALEDYKYTVSIENSFEYNNISEKLTDAFLTYTIPFYQGATNIEEYYPKDSYISIDINRYDHTLKKIENVLNNTNHYTSNFQHLKAARSIFLKEEIFSQKIRKFFNEMIENQAHTSDEYTIYPDPHEDFLLKIRRRVNNIFYKY